MGVPPSQCSGGRCSSGASGALFTSDFPTVELRPRGCCDARCAKQVSLELRNTCVKYNNTLQIRRDENRRCSLLATYVYFNNCISIHYTLLQLLRADHLVGFLGVFSIRILALVQRIHS